MQQLKSQRLVAAAPSSCNRLAPLYLEHRLAELAELAADEDIQLPRSRPVTDQETKVVLAAAATVAGQHGTPIQQQQHSHHHNQQQPSPQQLVKALQGLVVHGGSGSWPALSASSAVAARRGLRGRSMSDASAASWVRTLLLFCLCLLCSFLCVLLPLFSVFLSCGLINPRRAYHDVWCSRRRVPVSDAFEALLCVLNAQTLHSLPHLSTPANDQHATGRGVLAASR